MKYLDEKSILVREARIIYPSLEEVLVKVTGLEASHLKKVVDGQVCWLPVNFGGML